MLCKIGRYYSKYGFDNEWSQGENVYLSKLGYVIQHNI